MDRDDLDLDPEIAQLQLDQARHRLERLGRVARHTRTRIVEEFERRQAGCAGALEERHLLFLLHALALLEHRRRLLDARRRPELGLLLFLADRFGARFLVLAPGPGITPRGEVVAGPGHRAEHGASGRVHDLEPRHAREERHAGKPQAEKQQGRTEETEGAGEPCADHITEDAAGRVGETRCREVQRGKATARRQRQHEAGALEPRREAVLALRVRLALEEEPAAEGDQYRKEERRGAEIEVERIGEPGACPAGQVADPPGLAGVGITRILRIKAREREREDERHRTEHPQRALAQAAHHRRTETRRALGRGLAHARSRRARVRAQSFATIETALISR